MLDEPPESLYCSETDIDLLLSKHQLHIVALSDRFAALKKADAFQKEKLLSKCQEIAVLKERINELQLQLDEMTVQNERFVMAASQKNEEITKALTAELDRSKLSYQSTIQAMRNAQEEILLQSSTIYDLESQLRDARVYVEGGVDELRTKPLTKLLDLLSNRQKKFQSFLETSICAKVKQLNHGHKQVVRRQTQLHEQLQVALACQSETKESFRNRWSSTIRHMDSENKTLIQRLSSMEALLKKESIQRSLLEGELRVMTNNYEVIKGENQLLEIANQSLMNYVELVKSQLGKEELALQRASIQEGVKNANPSQGRRIPSVEDDVDVETSRIKCEQKDPLLAATASEKHSDMFIEGFKPEESDDRTSTEMDMNKCVTSPQANNPIMEEILSSHCITPPTQIYKPEEANHSMVDVTSISGENSSVIDSSGFHPFCNTTLEVSTTSESEETFTDDRDSRIDVPDMTDSNAGYESAHSTAVSDVIIAEGTKTINRDHYKEGKLLSESIFSNDCMLGEPDIDSNCIVDSTSCGNVSLKRQRIRELDNSSRSPLSSPSPLSSSLSLVQQNINDVFAEYYQTQQPLQ